MQWHPEYWEKRQKAVADQTGSADIAEPEQLVDARKDIIFRDADYNPLFKIKDGDRIKITVAYDGEELIRKCRWIDEAHMNVGSTPFHMDEFMEKAAKAGNKYEPLPSQPPIIDVVIAEPGKLPRDAELPMTASALRDVIGGKPEIISEDKYSVVVKVVNGNGTLLVCGISDGKLTSIHPYIAQAQKWELAQRLAAEKNAPTLADRLEAGKVKAAAYTPSADKTASKQRHTEVG
jgi:hypothetical protein